MTHATIFFITQVALACAAFAAAPRMAKSRSRHFAVALALALLILWPLWRVLSVEAVAIFGPAMVSCIEITGVIVPGSMALAIIAHRLPRKSDRRAVLVLICIAGTVVLWSGRWMIKPGIDEVGATRMNGSVCLQSTPDTCVAASLVTLLRARGIKAEEYEMTVLAGVEPGAGATDSRALWALQRKLRAAGLRAHYRRMSPQDLVAAPKPCLVQLRFGLFTSHMVPIMDADESRVVIGDPLEGLRTQSMAAFCKEWKGRAIVVENE